MRIEQESERIPSLLLDYRNAHQEMLKLDIVLELNNDAIRNEEAFKDQRRLDDVYLAGRDKKIR